MATHREIECGGERGQNDVAGIAGDAGVGADEENDRREHGLGREQCELTHQGTKEAKLFGKTDAQHADEDQAQRGQAREVADHGCDHPIDAVGSEQTARCDFERHGLASGVVFLCGFAVFDDGQRAVVFAVDEVAFGVGLEDGFVQRLEDDDGLAAFVEFVGECGIAFFVKDGRAGGVELRHFDGGGLFGRDFPSRC